MKKLSFLLVITVLLMNLIIPVGTSAATITPFADDFSGYADNAALQAKWVHEGSAGGTATLDAGALKVINENTNGNQVKSTITPGIAADKTIKINFRFKNDYSNEETHQTTLVWIDESNTAGKRTPLIYIKDGGTIYTGTNSANENLILKDSNGNAAQSVSGMWYDVEVIYDLAQKSFTTSLTDENDVVYTNNNGPGANIATVNQFRIQTWGGTANTESVTIDDIAITYVSSYFADDFSSYADSATLQAKWVKDGSAGGTATLDAGALKVINENTNGNQVKSTIAYGIAADKTIKINFRFKNDYSNEETHQTTLVWIDESNTAGKRTPLIYIKDGGTIYTGTNSANENLILKDSNGNAAQSVSGMWYDVEVIYDLAQKSFTTSLTDENDVVYTNNNGPGANIATVNQFRIQTWGGTANTESVTIDDIVIDDYVPQDDSGDDEEEESDALMDDNFNGYADDAALQAEWVKVGSAGGTATLGTGEDNSKALKVAIENTNGNQVKGAIAPGIAADKTIKVNFTFKNDYTNAESNPTTLIWIEEEAAGGKRTPLIYIDARTIYTGVNSAIAGQALKDSNGVAAQSVSGKWYDVEVIYDLVAKHYTISLTDESNVVYTGSCDGGANIATLNQFRIQSWGGTVNTDSVTIDDIVIDEYVSQDDEEETSNALLEDNFNSYETVDDMIETWTLKSTTSKEVLSLGSGEDATKALTMLCSTGSNYLSASFKETATAGKLAVTFKMMNDYSDGEGGTTAKQTSVISLANGADNKYIPVVYIKDGKMYTGVNSKNDARYICDSVSGTWYDVEVMFNVTDMTYDISVIDGATVYKKEAISVATFASAAKMTDVKYLRLQEWDAIGDGTHGKMTIDDMLVKYTTDAVDVNSTDLSFESAKGVKSYYASTVSASTEKINIDFGTVMNESSLNATTIILKNETENAVVSYTPDFEGTVYTMTLPRLLEPGDNYSLTITTGVKNLDEEPAAQEKVFNFTADSGECEVSFNAFAIGGNTAPTVAEIIAASSANVKMNVLNSTGIDKDLLIIVAYYKGNELVDVVYADYDMPYETYVNGIFEQNITLKTGLDADKVSIFAWDTISTMKPYTRNIIVPAQ